MSVGRGGRLDDFETGIASQLEAVGDGKFSREHAEDEALFDGECVRGVGGVPARISCSSRFGESYARESGGANRSGGRFQKFTAIFFSHSGRSSPSLLGLILQNFFQIEFG